MNMYRWTYIRKDGTRRTVLTDVAAQKPAAGSRIPRRRLRRHPLKRTAQGICCWPKGDGGSRQPDQIAIPRQHETMKSNPDERRPRHDRLLLTTNLDTQQRHLTRTIQQSGESLLAIINDDSRLLKVKPANSNWNSSISIFKTRSITPWNSLPLGPAWQSLELTCHMPSSIHPAQRPHRLRQALLNLIRNTEVHGVGNQHPASTR